MPKERCADHIRLRDSKIGRRPCRAGRDKKARNSIWLRPDRIRIDPPSCAASNITPDPSTRSNSRWKPKTKKAGPFASARSARGVMTVSCRASAASGAGDRIFHRRVGMQAALTMLGKLDTKPEFGPWWSRCSTAIVSPITRKWSRRCAMPTFAPSCISAIPKTWAISSICRPAQLALRDHPGLGQKGAGEVQIKDLIDGAKAAAAIASNQEWRETRPAHFPAARMSLSPRCAKCWRGMR